MIVIDDDLGRSGGLGEQRDHRLVYYPKLRSISGGAWSRAAGEGGANVVAREEFLTH